MTKSTSKPIKTSKESKSSSFDVNKVKIITDIDESYNLVRGEKE